MEHVLLSVEMDLGNLVLVDLLLEFVLQLQRGLHAVLGRAQDAADATLLRLRELGDLALLQDALDQARRRGDAALV